MMEAIIIFTNYSKIMLKVDNFNLYKIKVGFEFINIIDINAIIYRISEYL
jgi:hypothetical protein